MSIRLCTAIAGAVLFAATAAGPSHAESVLLPQQVSQTDVQAKQSSTFRVASQGSKSEAPPRPPIAIGPQSNPAASPQRGSVPMPQPTPTAASQSAGRDASGFDGKQRAIIGRVNAYLSNMQTLVGDFVQVGPDGRRTEGQFYLQKPGRVRFEYNPPSPIELISDGESVVVRDRKLATQDLYPLSQTPLRFLLADRIDLLKETNVIGVTADDVFVAVTIEERHALAGTHKLMLMFSAKDFQLRQWTVTDPQGYDTTVAVYNLDTTKKLDPSLFKIDYTRYVQ